MSFPYYVISITIGIGYNPIGQYQTEEKAINVLKTLVDETDASYVIFQITGEKESKAVYWGEFGYIFNFFPIENKPIGSVIYPENGKIKLKTVGVYSDGTFKYEYIRPEKTKWDNAETNIEDAVDKIKNSKEKDIIVFVERRSCQPFPQIEVYSTDIPQEEIKAYEEFCFKHPIKEDKNSIVYLSKTSAQYRVRDKIEIPKKGVK